MKKLLFAFMLVTLALIFSNHKNVKSQEGGGYICGKWEYAVPGSAPGLHFDLFFEPWPYLSGQTAWVPNNRPNDWGSNMDGVYTKLWNTSMNLGSYKHIFMEFEQYKIVPNCDPIIRIWSDNETITTGQCTKVNWNVDIAGLQSVILNGQPVDQLGQMDVCPLSTQTYLLQASYQENIYKLDENADIFSDGPFWIFNPVIQQLTANITIATNLPTSTPLPTSTNTQIPTKTLVPTNTPSPTRTKTPIPPAGNPIPPTAEPAITYGPLPNDGYDPEPTKPNILQKIIQMIVKPVEANYSHVDCQNKLAGPNNEYAGQCTVFVAGLRPDVCQWIEPGMGNAYQWKSQAELNGGSLGISVTSTPHIGDIAVWDPGCDYATSYGHVAIVESVDTKNNTFRVKEANWVRKNPDIKVQSCMSFVSTPSGNPINEPTPVSTPNPVPVPTPSGKPFDLLQWINQLFNP